MNSPISRSSAILLAVGATVVLLLGAFSRVDSGSATTQQTVLIQPAQQTEVDGASYPTLPPNLSPGLEEIIKLAQAHVDDGVMLAFIKNSKLAYAPTADEILYLKDLGVSQSVMAALFATNSSLPTGAIAAETPPPLPTGAGSSANALPGTAIGTNMFYDALTPYGTWMNVANYGLVWQPTAGTVNPDWRPYVDQGQWLYSDAGWYWQSLYSWGWAPFHYGRWTKSSGLGWLWIPGDTWAPAWVSWRLLPNYNGWAPLPPGVALSEAEGLIFQNQRVTADCGFGIPAGWFTFVSEENFLNENPASYALSSIQVEASFNTSIAVNNYSFSHHQVIDKGPGAAGVAAALGVKIEPVGVFQIKSAGRLLHGSRHKERQVPLARLDDLVTLNNSFPNAPQREPVPGNYPYPPPWRQPMGSPFAPRPIEPRGEESLRGEPSTVRESVRNESAPRAPVAEPEPVRIEPPPAFPASNSKSGK